MLTISPELAQAFVQTEAAAVDWLSIVVPSTMALLGGLVTVAIAWLCGTCERWPHR
jgi:hypothetical protein